MFLEIKYDQNINVSNNYARTLYITFTFMHLADAFIQSGLLCVHTAGGKSIKIQRNAVERFVDALT